MAPSLPHSGKVDITALHIRAQQGIDDEQGDFVEPIAKGLVRWDDVKDLSSLLAQSTGGRSSASQVTLFKQNSDQGVGFMALARLAHDKARSAGIGLEI